MPKIWEISRIIFSSWRITADRVDYPTAAAAIAAFKRQSAEELAGPEKQYHVPFPIAAIEAFEARFATPSDLEAYVAAKIAASNREDSLSAIVDELKSLANVLAYYPGMMRHVDFTALQKRMADFAGPPQPLTTHAEKIAAMMAIVNMTERDAEYWLRMENDDAFAAIDDMIISTHKR